MSRSIIIPPAVRVGFGALQSVSPSLAARVAERLFFTPPRVGLTREARELLHSGRRFTAATSGGSVVGWSWSSGPLVYLVHGWGSRAGQLATYVRPLVDAGFGVVAFDAPGHGESGRGLSSIPEFARALVAVAEKRGEVRAIVAHSLGGAATALAASWGLAAERFVLLAPSADPVAYAAKFAFALGARDDVAARMRANSERRLRFSWSGLDVCGIAARMTAAALVIHDRGDAVVPFAEGAAIAASWPGARLLPTDGLSHRRILTDPAVVTEVVQFVVGSSPPLTESAALEHELFYRETRWR